MAGIVDINISVDGQKELSNAFLHIGKSISNLRVPISQAVAYMNKEIQKQHDTSGTRFGQRWAALSAPYSARKASIWGNKPILEASGKMRRGYRDEIRNDYGKISNPTPYFKFHQLGTRKMPERVMMKIDETRQRRILKFFSDYIHKTVTNAK